MRSKVEKRDHFIVIQDNSQPGSHMDMYIHIDTFGTPVLRIISYDTQHIPICNSESTVTITLATVEV